MVLIQGYAKQHTSHRVHAYQSLDSLSEDNGTGLNTSSLHDRRQLEKMSTGHVFRRTWQRSVIVERVLGKNAY